MKTSIELIAEERQRQIEVEGYSLVDDASFYANGELAIAASIYALPAEKRASTDTSFVPLPDQWPWDRASWKPTPELRLRELAKAGALIAAEMDRLQELWIEHVGIIP